MTATVSPPGVEGEAQPRPAPAPATPTPARRRAAVLLLLILAGGLALRLVDLDDSPLNFHPGRQYRSALLAHSYLLDETRPADDPERVNAALAARLLGDLEPPLIEQASVAVWRVSGSEDLRIPRLMGIAAWMAGAVACWSILGRRRDRIAQVVGTTTFCVLPMGVAASRAFQPDALMVAATLGAMALILRAEDEGRPRLWLTALVVSAVAILVKPMCAPIVLGWAAAVVVSSRGWSALWRGRVVAAIGVIMAPTAAYFAFHAVTGGASSGWLGGSLVPRLFLEGRTYAQLVRTVDRAVPIALLLVAGVAIAFAGRRDRLLLGAAVGGHVAMMVLVNYRAATHDYYHLPLVALVALGLGIGVSDATTWIRRRSFDDPVRRAVLALGATALLLSAVSFATGHGTLEGDLGPAAAQVEANRSIGELTGHSREVLALTYAFGADLAYEGGVVSTEHPGLGDALLLEARGLPVPTPAEVIADSGADWFAVTNLAEWERHPDLQDELRTRHTLVAEGEGWMLWRLTPA